MTDHNYTNTNITETVVLSQALSGNSIASIQAIYPFTEADYVRLDSQGNIVKTWATSFLFVAIGSAVTLLQNVFKDGLERPNDIAPGDLVVLAVLSLVTVLLFAVSAFVPNEKKKLMKRIDKFFKNSPSQNHFFRGSK
ncbi:hypothetical protein [Pseudomonas sp.]|uniref:hypothetical protein n=1 Tax=Pseudomonas sp. TaxID=306 RepID=UPI0028B0216A|nr:hypothetical protein [Pseudomonas sp.]